MSCRPGLRHCFPCRSRLRLLDERARTPLAPHAGPSTPRRKTEPLSGTGSCHQRLAFHGPAERLGHGGVEVGDEAFDPLLKMLLGGEAAATGKLADQDRKPNLDLVDPRGML